MCLYSGGLMVSIGKARAVTDDIYHNGFGAQTTVHETWTIGGISYGANVGLRLLIR